MQRCCLVRRARAVLTGSFIVGYTAYLGGFLPRNEEGEIRRASKALLFDHASPFQAQSFQTELHTVLPEQPSELEVVPAVSEYTVLAGETLSEIWAKLGAGRDGGLKAAQALKTVHIPCSNIRAGERLLIERSDGDIVSLEKRLAEGATVRLEGSSLMGYTARVESPDVVEEERSVSGLVYSSFSSSARENGLPYELVDDFVDLFSSRVEFQRDFQPGDTFTIVYAHRRTSNGDVLKPGAIKAASIKLGNKFLASVLHSEKGKAPQYFDERGRLPGDFFLRYPLKYTRISSVFSGARFHPILNKSRAHNGVDFSAPTGTPVRSIGSGEVLFSGYTRSTGYMVQIQHNERFATEYMHLSRIATGLKRGDKVTRGELIGAVGSTGLSTGPHLHFGLFDRGKYVDPLKAKLPELVNDGKPPALVLATIKQLEQQHEMLALDNTANKRHA